MFDLPGELHDSSNPEAIHRVEQVAGLDAPNHYLKPNATVDDAIKAIPYLAEDVTGSKGLARQLQMQGLTIGKNSRFSEQVMQTSTEELSDLTHQKRARNLQTARYNIKNRNKGLSTAKAITNENYNVVHGQQLIDEVTSKPLITELGNRLGGLPNNFLKIARDLPKIPKWARVGSALTLLGIIGDSVQAAETNKEVQEKGWGAKQYMDAASVATGVTSLANPMFAGPSAVFGLTGAAMGRREDQRDLLQRQLNNPDEWMWNKENTQFVPIPQSGGDFSHSKENPVTIKPTQTATQIINQQHREFALAMEPKTSQTMATKLGDAVEKWATNPANEVKYVYNNLSNWLQNLGNIQ